MNIENKVYPEINIEKYKEIENELQEYKAVIEHDFQRFKKYQWYTMKCLALTKNNEQCLRPAYHSITNHILCKYHCKKKYTPDYVIIYIHNYLEKKNDDYHIITYPYKNKEKYNEDIEHYKKELIDTKLNSIIKLKQITKCKVCLEDFDNKDLLKCSNTSLEHQHFVCSDCLTGYINSQLLNNIGNNECMFHGADMCDGIYNDSIVNKAVDNPEIKEKWNEMITITNIFKISNICDNYQICPLCRKWGCILDITNVDMINNSDKQITIKCEQCQLNWCNTCKREAHGDDSCYKLKFKDDENELKQSEIIDKMIQDIISTIITRKCSTCGCAYIKEEGCNLMTCNKCFGMTCYLCNAKIYYKEGKGKYWHFIGYEFSDENAVCTIFNNNPGEGDTTEGNSLHTKKNIIKAIYNFIIENDENVIYLITKRLQILYEKDEDYKFIFEILDKFIDKTIANFTNETIENRGLVS